MKVGDLIQKVRGYGHNQRWTALVLGIHKFEGMTRKVEVLTEDGIEHWHFGMCEVING